MRAVSRRAAIATTGAALSAPALAWAAPPPPGAPPAIQGDMALGNPRAKVTVVEYLSLTCPHCAHFNETVFPTFKTRWVDTGKVRYVLRELLTPPENVAAAGFLLARCAGPGKYFPVVDEVLRSQPRWQAGQIKPIFVEIAARHGLTAAQFEACLTDTAAQDAMDGRLRYAAETDKVTSTPTFFVNGRRLPDDTVPTLADLEAAAFKAPKPAGRS